MELASLLKTDRWHYFATLTTNDLKTPAVRKITEAIKMFDDVLEMELIDNYLPFTLRACERFVRTFFQELITRNDTILGKVKSIFYRYEWGSGCWIERQQTSRPSWHNARQT